jgi:hypothetical protein
VDNSPNLNLLQKIKESKYQKSYRTVKGLDISSLIQPQNIVAVTSQHVLGVVVVETNRIISLDSVSYLLS